MSLFVPTVVLLSLVAEPGAAVDREVFAMGTVLRVRVDADDRRSAMAAGERAIRAIEAAEQRLSTWRPDSELSRLNASPVGGSFRLSARLAAELRQALDCSDATSGAFDPTIGALSRLWGLHQGGRRAGAEELRSGLAASGARHLRLVGAEAVRGVEELRLDAGGFGKGAGLAAAVEALERDPAVHGAVLDLGGQLAVIGADVFPVAVAHPGERSRPVLRLAVAPGSIATSGNSERGVPATGGSHMLDPRTGRPVQWHGSVTVWSRDALLADCLATGLYVLGADAALDLAARLDGVEVVVLERLGDGLRARASAGLAGRVEQLVDLVVEFSSTGAALEEADSERVHNATRAADPSTNQEPLPSQTGAG